MSTKEIVARVATYLSDVQFLEDPVSKKMDEIVRICVCEMVTSNAAPEYFFSGHFVAEAARNYLSLLNVEYVAARYVAGSSNDRWLGDTFGETSRQCSILLEYLVTRLCELFFLSERDREQFWREVFLDQELRDIMARFGINELVSKKEAAPDIPVNFTVTSSERSATLRITGSYIVALLREDARTVLRVPPEDS